MRSALILILSLFTASIVPCHANLGDTMDQCIARYGKRMPPSGVADPAQAGGVAATFQQNGYNFEVYLFNGVVECESITKIDNSLFSDQEKDKVVQMESAS